MLRASVIVDYQNVHMTARDVFDPAGPPHSSLIHPVLFARAATARRNARQKEGHPHAEVVDVHVFRGLPHVDHDWEQHRRAIDQARSWENAGAKVELRDLQYFYQRAAGGEPVRDINGKKVPEGKPREKGIDILCALKCVSEAERDDIDLVVLASRDTDLVPVLDELVDRRVREPARFAKIETFSWFDPQVRKTQAFAGGSIKPTGGRRVWNTNLDRSVYDAALDRDDYR